MDEVESLRKKVVETKLPRDLESILSSGAERSAAPAGRPARQDLGLVKNVWREDGEPRARGGFTADILAAAPRVRDGYIEVKKILNTDNG